MFNASTLLSRVWTMSQITHVTSVKNFAWKSGGVKNGQISYLEMGGG